ncbi:hypothetical protein E8L99_16540 [Phreatobacter aquaticus]|uniref:Terminase n=1 Tax=Phreatobacter aquaticus TaxID=2570229 RepID=A0A4D7QHJ6_9HYPH|nr:terminase gpA endonuclease subunit [Phreatobacter aquaticus]QCK87250.1 hypothetical protein E8L99_16540 [Phreatobacter aquaticus]
MRATNDADDILKAMLAALVPPKRITPGEWVEKNLELPASAVAIPGPIKLFPYQKAILDEVYNPRTTTLVLKTAAQIGKSLLMDSAISYLVANEPGPMLLVQPTTSAVESYVQTRLVPLFAGCRALPRIDGPLNRLNFDGGTLHSGSSHKAEDLASKSIKYLFLDEVDRFAQSAGSGTGNGEGDPVQLSIARTTSFPETKKIILASTPTFRGSRIETWFNRGDQREYRTSCPHCGGISTFGFDELRWTKGKPQTAHLECPACLEKIHEAQRQEMLLSGFWEANAEGEPGTVSFHLSAFANPRKALSEIVQEYEAALASGALQAFHNLVLGLSTSAEELSLSDGDLQARAEQISLDLIPDQVVALTCGCDVQGNRIEATIIGHAATGESWVLDHKILFGDTSGPEPWRQLEELLTGTWVTEDGKHEVTIFATLVDSGYISETVYLACRHLRSRVPRIYPSKGTAGFDKPFARQGAFYDPAGRIMLVGADRAKMDVQKRLSEVEHGPRYLHLPDHLPETYFTGLTSEKLVRKVDKRGYTKLIFEKLHPSIRNEPLDCAALALAAAHLLKLERIKPRPRQATSTHHTSAPAKPTMAELARALNQATNGVPNGTSPQEYPGSRRSFP